MVVATGTVVDAARGLAPLLERDREAAEDRAEMTEEVREAVGAAGLFSLLAPREVGGEEATLPDYCLVTEELAVADPSVAWHVANSMVLGLIAASLGNAEREEIFEDSNYPYGWSVATSGRATPVEGGFRLSGHWGFVTGVSHARWCALQGVVAPSADAEGAPDVRVFVVRRAELEVHRTFQTATSMRGTGSHAASAEDVFVPAGFVYRWDDPRRIDRAIYRLPMYVVAMAHHGGLTVGLLRSALAGLVEMVAAKASSVSGAPHWDQPQVKETVANAGAAVRSLRAGMLECSAEVQQAAEAGEVPVALRAQQYALGFYCNDTARQLISDLYVRSSSHTYARRNAVERALRDVHAVAAVLDGGMFRSLQGGVGRVLLGHDPGPIPRF